MAQTLKATSLALRLEQYNSPRDYGDFHVLPQEMLELIIQILSDKENIQDLYHILSLNKTFHNTMASALLHLDLSRYCENR